ncbi:MAG: peptide-methionine (S)-S-oxide reductase MsrA [Cyclobacteriaceae bacterium]
MKYLSLIISTFFLLACNSEQQAQSKLQPSEFTVEPASISASEAEKLDTATFAAGCFWCVEAVFERVKGVKSVVSGYAGGNQPNPTYQEVAAGKTDYAETVQIYYNPEEVNYQQLLEIFFATHDPTQLNRQGPDVGKQYRTEIFYHDARQQELAQEYMQQLSESGKYEDEIVTRLSPLDEFYVAEDYHQNYYENNPNDRYIVNIAVPKIKKFKKNFPDMLKEEVS